MYGDIDQALETNTKSLTRFNIVFVCDITRCEDINTVWPLMLQTK